MTHPFELILTAAGAVAALSGAAAAVSHPGSAELVAAAWWSTFPIVGAILSSGTAFLLSSENEPKKHIYGRALFALLSGVVGPRLAVIKWPALNEYVTDPILLIAAGAGFGLVGYAISIAVVRWMLVKAPEEVKKKLNKFITHEDDVDADDNDAGRLHRDDSNRSV